MDRVEDDLKQFIEQYERSKDHFDNDLDLIERDIAQIERTIEIKVCDDRFSVHIRAVLL